MIQCALNGARRPEEHPAVPIDAAALAADAAACRDAGASSVHLHPRRVDDGHETLAAADHDRAVAAVRAASPGLEISCSTQEDIDVGGCATRIEAVQAWRRPPDLVSLNVYQDDAGALGKSLLTAGIGIEAGVFTLRDADRLLTLPWAPRVHRILVEIIDDDLDDVAAVAVAQAIDARVAALKRPRLWHAQGATTWAVVEAGLRAGHDVRVGLEDTLVDRHGARSACNAAQVRDAVITAGASASGAP